MKIEKKYIILLLLIILKSNLVEAHPFYVSICQVNYNKESQTLEISIKTFADDLLLGLENNGKSKIYLGEAKEHPKTDTYIFEYFKRKLNFSVNNRNTEYAFIGREQEKDIVWTYLEIKNVNSLETIQVECSILTEVFAGQSNIIQVNNGETIKNLLLSKNKTTGSLEF